MYFLMAFNEFYPKIHKNSLVTRQSEHFFLIPGTPYSTYFCLIGPRTITARDPGSLVLVRCNPTHSSFVNLLPMFVLKSQRKWYFWTFGDILNPWTSGDSSWVSDPRFQGPLGITYFPLICVLIHQYFIGPLGLEQPQGAPVPFWPNTAAGYMYEWWVELHYF